MRLGVFLRLLVSVVVVALVYLSRRELVVVAPFSRPVVADAFDADDVDDDVDSPVTLTLGEIDDEDSSVTCCALNYINNNTL